MIRTSLITVLLLAPAVAMAHDDAASAAGGLDLSVPQAPVRYLGDTYKGDAPGTYYGDHSGRGLAKKDSSPGAEVMDDKLQVHGTVSAGIGYSKAYGNSNWQAVDLNLGKNYNTDEGESRRVNLNIHMSKSDGPGPYGYGPGPGFGPGPWGGW
ncbi:hypothetical protein [Stenotrophomonas pigmentata]|uniref:hypothetical protein n=1 Tax=Stenotrophomonas pigmentata TaxID=3055080 RepID=UPI0026F2499F|nr:hypothetical protein [Stenotrophomonas sp. 610A2]